MSGDDATLNRERREAGGQDDDAQLLRRYAHERSEEAFATLVRRHLDLVYAVALRQVGGDAHLAQDVAQTVFTSLARKAASLAARPVLGGWLYRTTQFTAIDVVRSESRRRAREQEAQTMPDPSFHPDSGGAVDWDKLRPTLDQAIGELNDADRDAVVLRFFEGKSFAAVGAKLRLTENTARMRVDRALDKLHALLARRGVTSTTAALAVALANQPAAAAPVGLAGIVTGTALAGVGATASLWTFLMTSKLTLGALGATAAFAAGAAVYQTQELHRRDAALAAATADQQALQAKIRDVEARVATEAKRAQAVDDDNAKLLKVIEGMKTARVAQATAAAAPITHDTVEARYKHAQDLARSGDTAAALKEFLWCLDEGMVKVSSYSGVRRSFLLSEIEKLGAQDPAALAALRDRRDAAEKRMLSSAKDYDSSADFAALNRTLKEDARTVQAYDQLDAADPRRRTMAMLVFDQLVEAQRYKDALEGRTYDQMASRFEMNAAERPLPAGVTNPEALRAANRKYVVTTTTAGIEVLAGVGDLDHARTLATRLLAYDGSDNTKAVLQQHLSRAGHADLLAAGK